MGIQGLLQALKPYVEPVHASKYSGQRVGIDAYSWLHKGAYACSLQQLREIHTRQSSERLPPFVTYCMHRIKMLLHNNVTPVVVFDGGNLPLKALTEQNRRRIREENVQKAEQKLAEGDFLSAQDYFQKAVEVTPLMAYELIKVLRDEGIDYVVAPYEADAQLTYLSKLAPEEGGVSAIITEDSDLLAYGCNVVLFKMDKFGSGEELCLDRMLNACPPPATGLSFRNFTKDLFLAMCVLAGCDFLASIPGIGVKTAHSLLAKYRNVHRVLNKLKFSKHVPEDYITNFWQAKAIFNHARVYEKKSRSLTLLNPLPDELLKEFGGETEFLGPDLPQSRARAIAIGQLDPITMCSFDVLPSRTPTPFAISKNPDLEFIQAQKVKFSKIPKMELLQPLGTSVFEESKDVFQVSWGSSTESLQSVPALMTEMRMDPDTSQTVMPSTPPEVDQKTLADLKFRAASGSHQQISSEDAAPSQMSRQDFHGHGMRRDIPNNNPFRSHQVGQSVVHPDISKSPRVVLEWKEHNSGLSAQNPDSNFFSSVEDSQPLSSPGEALRSELNSLHRSRSSLMTPAPEGFCCTTVDQRQLKEELVAHVKRLDCSNSQSSSNSGGVSIILTDISPNVVAVSPAYEYPMSGTPSSAPLQKTKDAPFETGEIMGSAKAINRLKKSKSASQIHKRNVGGKRSRGSSSQTPLQSEGSILRFFKPIPTP